MSKIHFLDINPSAPSAVLFLHGLGADSTSWGLQFPALTEAGYRSIAIDAPGFGSSPYDGRGWNIPHVASQVAELIRELGTGPVHVVGLSMGGTIAQQFALDRPELIKKLVLVSTFTVLRPETLSGWLYFAQRLALVHTLGLKYQAPVVARRVFPHPKDEELRQQLIKMICQADPRAYRAAMRSLGTFDSRRRLATLRAPTLVITGNRDSTVSPARQTLLAEHIPGGAQQVIITEAGHGVNIDQPEQFNDTLLDFLSK